MASLLGAMLKARLSQVAFSNGWVPRRDSRNSADCCGVIVPLGEAMQRRSHGEDNADRSVDVPRREHPWRRGRPGVDLTEFQRRGHGWRDRKDRRGDVRHVEELHRCRYGAVDLGRKLMLPAGVIYRVDFEARLSMSTGRRARSRTRPSSTSAAIARTPIGLRWAATTEASDWPPPPSRSLTLRRNRIRGGPSCGFGSPRCSWPPVAGECRVPESGVAFASAKSGKASEGKTRD